MEEDKKQEVREQKENKKIVFFNKVWNSITNPEKYPEMAMLGFSSAMRYIICLMAIFAFILCGCMMYKTYTIVNNTIDYLEKEFPNLSYKEGTLNINSQEPLKFNDSNSIFGNTIIDTNIEDEETINKYKEEISKGDTGIIVLKNELVVKTPALSSLASYKYTDLIKDMGTDITEFTKQDIINIAKSHEIMPLYVALFIIVFIYTFILYYLSVLIDTLVLAALGYLTTLITKMKMKFVAIYNMSVYSLTLSIILNLVYIVINIYSNFEIKYFQVMYTSVAFIYLAAAIFIIKSDFIKKQMELLEIVEKQKQMKEELEEKVEKRKEEKDKSDEDKKEEENKNDKKESGDEPESSEA